MLLSYRWSNGATELSLANLAGGDYTNCYRRNRLFKDTTLQSDVTCIFVGTFNMLLVTDLLTEPLTLPFLRNSNYIFEWDNGMMTETSGLTAGTRLKITDGNGCSAWGAST